MQFGLYAVRLVHSVFVMSDSMYEWNARHEELEKFYQIKYN